MVVRCFEVWLAKLDPTVGGEMQKTRPVAIVSPDVLNGPLRCIQAAPLTSNTAPYPFRQPCFFRRKMSSVALDQIRTLDKSRLVKRLGQLSEEESRGVCVLLQTMYAYE